MFDDTESVNAIKQHWVQSTISNCLESTDCDYSQTTVCISRRVQCGGVQSTSSIASKRGSDCYGPSAQGFNPTLESELSLRSTCNVFQCNTEEFEITSRANFSVGNDSNVGPDRTMDRTKK